MLSISDPALAEWFGVGTANYSGVDVGEGTALTVSAWYRAISLISGTIASLPLRTVRDTGDGMRQRVTSFLDNPGGDEGPTPLEWKETVVAHALQHGDAFLAHVFNGAGALAGLVPLHPLGVSVRWRRPEEESKYLGRKVYTATLIDGSRREFDMSTLTQISSLSLDGLRGLSLMSLARNGLGTAIAGERAAAKMFSSGLLISGMVTPEGDLEEDEVTAIKAGLNRHVAGWDNAGEIAVINRNLKFTPWTATAEDMQFIESRQFQIEEISRWTGVPPHLLMQTEKQTSWGQGVESQNRAMGRTVLSPWTGRIEQRLSRLLPSPRFVEFDFAGLERPTPEVEIDLLLKQIAGGLLTLNEARAIRNLPPVPGGDVLQTAQPAAPVPAGTPEEVPV